MNLKMANPRGFCAGVGRAIAIVNRALDVFGEPIYVRHEVVHNKFVVDGLRDRGAIFVDELHQVPDDSIVIFSAHGVSQKVQKEAKDRGLKVFDATCPLVTKVHMEVTKYANDHRECVLIGHEGHPEVEGTMGQYHSDKGDIWINKRKVDIRSVQANIERLKAENPQGTVVIQADKKSTTDILIKVMDSARAAGVFDVSIAAQEV